MYIILLFTLNNFRKKYTTWSLITISQKNINLEFKTGNPIFKIIILKELFANFSVLQMVVFSYRLYYYNNNKIRKKKLNTNIGHSTLPSGKYN